MRPLKKNLSTYRNFISKNNKLNISSRIYPVIISLWIFFYFLLLLNTGFIGDDIWNAQIRGQLIEQNISLLDRINNEWIGWLLSNGSIRILYYFIIYPIFYLTQDPIFFKSLTLFFLISSSLLFYYFLARLANNKDLSLLIGLFLPIFFQFREWNDPILGFPSYMMPFTVSLILISLILYQKYIETLIRKFNYLSTFFLLVNILLYEIAVPFLIAYIFLSKIKLKKLKLALIEAKLQIIVTTIYLLVVFFVNNIYIPFISKNSVSYTAVQFHFSSLSKLAEAFFIQLIGSIPLTHFLFSEIKLNELSINGYELTILLIASFLIFGLTRKLINSWEFIKITPIIKIALILFIAPAFLTALSGHQGDLRYLGFGNAYIPVYIQYFGACVILVTTLMVVLNKLKNNNIKCVLVAFIFFIVSSINYSTNKDIVNKLKESHFNVSNLVTSSIIAGLMNNVEDKSMIFQEMITPSSYYRNYIAITGKKLTTCEIADIDQRSIDGGDNYRNCINFLLNKFDANGRGSNNDEKFKAMSINLDLRSKNAWVLKIIYDKKNEEKGYVIIGKIKRIKKASKTNNLSEIRLSKLLIYENENQTINSYKYDGLNFVDILSNKSTETEKIRNYLLKYEL